MPRANNLKRLDGFGFVGLVVDLDSLFLLWRLDLDLDLDLEDLDFDLEGLVLEDLD